MKHYDCKYFLAVDAFKGICKRDKCNINADDASCEHFEKAKKCLHCSNFTPISEDMGKCMQKYDTFPQMNSSTCNDFQWN